jgi:adenylate cyclase
LANLGLSTIQVLSAPSYGEDQQGSTNRLAVVFTDLEGFTRFTAKQGDEAARSLLAEHHRFVGPIVRSRGGKVVKRLGDGLMLSFPEPDAAVHCSLDLVDVPAELRLRAGVHTGEAVVTADDMIGHDVNIAARVAADAQGGQVLATVRVREEVGDLRGVTFGRARRRSFKGVGEPISVCPVMRA